MAKKLSKNGKKIGRPSKLAKPEIAEIITDTICENLKEGAPRKAAVGLAGIKYDTFLSWKERGEAGEQPFRVFMDRIEQAEFEIQRDCMGKWQGHCDNDWRAIDRFLQVRFKDEFGEKSHGGLQVSAENVLIIAPQPCDTAEEWEQRVQQYLNNKGNGLDGNLSLAHKPSR